jgi:hypothetical protein
MSIFLKKFEAKGLNITYSNKSKEIPLVGQAFGIRDYRIRSPAMYYLFLFWFMVYVYSKHYLLSTMHGRRTLAIINALDAVTLSYVVLILLLTLDSLDFYDTLLNGAHWVHAITVPLGYVIVRRSTPVKETLRVLVMLYMLALAFDVLAVTFRLLLLTSLVMHAHTAAAPIAGGVHCFIALAFVGLDICGGFFGDFASQYALVPPRNDAQMIAAATRIAKTPAMYTEQTSPMLGPRIVSVHNQMPQQRLSV